VGWKDWVLYFKDADFNEIKHKLERWYNVKIEVRGSLQGKAFSGKFINDSLEEVLNGIGFTLHFQYEISEGIVTIQSNL
jgi:ferric-dicitrate binding protein FerR (iron transport regulator)